MTEELDNWIGGMSSEARNSVQLSFLDEKDMTEKTEKGETENERNQRNDIDKI